MAEARAAWKAAQPDLDPRRLVFIDETGTSTNMARLYGRGKRGQRVVGRVPWGHWKTMTFLAGLRHDAITAPFVIDCAMTRAIFQEYLRLTRQAIGEGAEFVLWPESSMPPMSRCYC